MKVVRKKRGVGNNEAINLVEVGNDSVHNLLGGAISTEIFCPVLALRNDTLDSSLKAVSKGGELKMPQHHGGREKQSDWISLLLLHHLLVSHISCRCTLLKHSMISPNIP